MRRTVVIVLIALVALSAIYRRPATPLSLLQGCRTPRTTPAPTPAPVASLSTLTSNFNNPVHCTESDSLQGMLSAEGRDRCNSGVSPTERAYTYPTNPAFQVSEGTLLAAQPLNYANRYAAETSLWLDEAAESGNPVSRAIRAAAFRQGYALSGSARTATDLNVEIRDLFAASGGVADCFAVTSETSKLPYSLATRLAPIIRAIREAHTAREQAFAPLSAQQRQLLFNAYPNWADNPGAASIYNAYFPWTAWNDANNYLYRDAVTKVDYARLYTAALNLALTIEAARLADFANLHLPASVNISTPIGYILVYDVESTTYAWEGEFAIMLDLGGNDTHVSGGANRSITNSVSVMIDLAGNDTYAYLETPNAADDDNPNRLPSDAYGRASSGRTLSEIARQGSGRCGTGLSFDLGNGTDNYRSLRISQGFGLAGVGALYDEAGTDTYKTEAGSQGAAHFGIGLLIDRAGADNYLIYHSGQGYGGSKGFGAISDYSGDDIYTAVISQGGHGGEDLYPGADGMTQTYAQGLGYGARRYDASSVPYPISASQVNLVFAGGVGVLRDRAGNDQYTSAGQSLGSGYYFGIGLLDDGGGDDHYWSHGRYSEGGAPHAGIGLFIDRSGNDRHNQNRAGVYFAPGYVMMGFGYDFGVGFFLDRAGNDVYTGPAFAYGATQYSGTGFFLDQSGNDSFNTNAGAYYMAAAPSSLQWDYAASAYFIDAGGSDTYNTNGYPPGCGNSLVWDGIGTHETAKIYARGGDFASGSLVFP